MRILFLSHYFPPEGNAPATRTHENCKRWVQQGHELTVITCAPNVPDGVIYEGYKNKLYQRETIDGINVVRVWSYIAANAGTLRRIINYISFAAVAVVASLFMRKPDIIIATSPQFFCGWAGVVASLLRRVVYVLEIRDIWPDSIIAVGAMKPSRLLRFVYVLERWMYRAAYHIVTVGDGYREELQKKGVPNRKITVITNGVDVDEYAPRPPDHAFKERLGITRPFVCSYVGTIGMASGLHVTLACAKLLKQRGRDDIALVLVGDGAIRQQLQKEAQIHNLDNITFTGRLGKELMSNVLSFSDVSFVHLKKKELFQTVLPSKIFEAASMERPIILGVEGASAALLRRADAGICVEPENPRELTDALIELADHPAERMRMGSNGREFVKAHFERNKLADEYLALLEQLVAHGRPHRKPSMPPGNTSA